MASTKIGPWDTKINRLLIGDSSLILEDAGVGEMFFTIDGVEVMSLTVYGMQLFDSGPRIDMIYDNDDLSPDSATALATQQSIKAYVDAGIGAIDLDRILEGNSQVEVIDTGTGRVEITIDGTLAGTWNASGLTMVESLTIPDGKTIVFGSAGLLYSNATSVVLSNAAGTEILWKATQDGAIELYFNSAIEAETVSGALKATNGFTIAAEQTVTAFTGVDLSLVTGTGGTANLGRWNSDGDLVAAASAITDANLDNLISGNESILHKHTASYINLVDSGGWYTATEVEAALQELAPKVDAHNLNGFEDASAVALSSDAGTPPTITLTFTGTVYWWSDGVRYSDTGTDALQIDDTNGIHIIYYDGSTLSKVANPTHFQMDQIIWNKGIACIVYWNTNTNVAPVLASELHGVQMSGRTHEWIHDNMGAKFREGGALSGYTLNSAADVDISFDVTDLEFYDEDIEVEIEDGVATNQYEQVLTGDAEIPVLYRDDVSGHWIEQAASTLPYLTAGGEPERMNDDGDGTWSRVAVANIKFFNQFLLATNDWQYPVKMVAGTTEYANQSAALEGASAEINAWTTLPAAEWVLLYQFILQSWNGGTVDVRIKEIIDFRFSQISGASAASATDHGSLTGLGDDDHAHYVHIDGSHALTANWDAGPYKITAEQFESDIVTGTSPIVVDSTTVVTNLNADTVDAKHSTDLVLVDGTQDMVMAPGTNWAITDSDGDNLAIFNSNAEVGLYHNNVEVLQTRAGGITVGTTWPFSIYENAGETVIEAPTDMYLANVGRTAYMARFQVGGEVALLYNGANRLQTSAAGLTVTGVIISDGLTMGDNEYITFGVGPDGQIYSDGTNLVISNGDHSETFIQMTPDGEIQFYYNNLHSFASIVGGMAIGSSDMAHLHVTGDAGGDQTTTGFSIGNEHPSYVGSGFDDDITDGSNPGAWYCYRQPSGGYVNSGWVGQDFGAGNAKTVSSYTVMAMNSATRTYDPKDWTFEGSSTGAWGGEEDVLDTVTGESFSGAQDKKTYTISSPAEYRYYRINVSANNGHGTYLIIQELEFITAASLATKLEWIGGVFEINNIESGDKCIVITEDAGVDLYYNNAVKLAVTGSGATLTGVLVADGVTLGDNEYITLGAGPDCLIYSDGANLAITNGAGTEYFLLATPNGNVQIYYDSILEAETISGGFKATNSFTIAATTNVTGILDDDTMAADSAVSLCTQQSIVAYVGTQIGAISTDKIEEGDSSVEVIDAGGAATIVGTVDAETAFVATAQSSVDLYYDNVVALKTASTGIYIYEVGGDSVSLQISAATSNFDIFHSVNSAWINLTGKNAAGGNEALIACDPDAGVSLYYQGDLALQTTALGISISDPGGAKTASAYFSGDHFEIYNSKASGHVRLYGKDVGNAYTPMGVFDPDGSVDLYYDGTKKFETSNTGATLTGILVADGLTMGTNEPILFTSSKIYDSGTELTFRNNAGTENLAKFASGGECKLYHNNAAVIYTMASGMAVHDGDGDDPKITFRASGAGANVGYMGWDDTLFGLYHWDGAAAWDIGFTSTFEGSVDLYYDNSKKFATTATGVEIGDGTDTCELKYSAGTLILNNLNHGAPVEIAGETGGGAARTMLSLDPGGVQSIGESGDCYFQMSQSANTMSIDVGGTRILTGAVGSLTLGYTADTRLELDPDASFASIYANANQLGLYCVGGGAVNLYYAGDKVFNTTDTGIEVGDGTDIADFEMTTGNFEIKNTHDGGEIALKRMHATSVEKNVLKSSDSTTVLYDNAGNEALATSSVGIKTTTSAGYHAQMRFDGTQLNLTSYQHGGNVGLLNEDAGGVMQNLVIGDPDGSVDLYYDGTKTVSTGPDSINFHQAGGLGGRIYIDGGNELVLQNRIDGENVKINADDAASAEQVLFEGDPDGSVDLYYDGVKAVETNSNGITTIGEVKFPAAQSASADANALDDYEEGTWTPTAADLNTGGNETTTGTGTYTKVGRIVTVTWVIANIDTTGLTGGNVFYITGLPFVAGAGYSHLGSMASDSINHDAATVNIASSVSAGQDAIYFMETRDNTTVLNMLVSQLTDDTTDIWGTLTYTV